MTTATAITNEAISCKIHSRKISASADLAALSEVFSRLVYPTILGGNKSKESTDRFSYWMAEPKEVFELHTGCEKPFEKLQKVLGKYKLDENSNNGLPGGIFCGGWAGYFGYELARHIEKLPQTTIDDIKTPLIRLCFYDKVICYDHSEKIFWLIALELPKENHSVNQKLESLQKLIEQSGGKSIEEAVPARPEQIDFSKIKCNMDKNCYLKAVERIKRYIYNGDVYQINFSQRFECDFSGRPVDLFNWQNHFNPSPYSAYIGGDDFHIVSTSPEMFITITDGVISTKPIKGTRPLTSDNAINDRNYNELLVSQKEQAELNMIVDLERNDMVKICEYGTRTVTSPRTIESYPTVFHAAATVAGTLRKEVTICDILKAMFPGGSITGAPKVAAMEIIDETEPNSRGVYTGSIGFISLNGNVCLNIAIRTIIITDKKAYVQTGGGIVADSEPQAEYEETLTKAKALLEGINSVHDGKSFSK